MTEQKSNNNRNDTVAALRNVATFAALINRIKNRGYGLPGIGVFYGPSGFGKTFAGIYGTNRFGAIHVEVKSFWRNRALCEAILKEMGITKPGKTIAAMMDQISKFLADEDVPLFVDEADVLVKHNMIEIIRDIHEGSGATIILIGEENLPQSLRAFERVHNRVLDWVAAQPTDLTDARSLANFYVPGVAVDEALLVALIEATDGIARRIVVNLDRIREEAVVKGLKKVTLSDFAVSRFFTGDAPAVRRFASRLKVVK